MKILHVECSGKTHTLTADALDNDVYLAHADEVLSVDSRLSEQFIKSLLVTNYVHTCFWDTFSQTTSLYQQVNGSLCKQLFS